ncbi:MAG: glucose-1-phosphate thymidylyltransferase [Muribaculaceae bacterium]|nr:glucose-1-phosphate thymidylyltransferase [Muribaculaceae bacterium]
MNIPTTIYLVDTPDSHENLLPLSFTRPVADFRIGITTIRQKWEDLLPGSYNYFPVEYLREKFGNVADPDADALFITGALLPDPMLIEAISNLRRGQALFKKDTPLAYHGTLNNIINKEWETVEYERAPRIITYVFDIFLLNPHMIKEDFSRLTNGRTSRPLPASNRVIGDFTDEEGNPMIFIEEGASVEGATINLKGGPVYIGRNAEIMEGSCVRGPLAMCEKAKIRMGSKIYGGSTFGPYCKVGGEIDNAVMFGYSNKAHDGYLGNAVVGEWCNIGAGVNASNLKNDYSKIRVWNYRSHTFMRTDLQFCGPIIGDHTKIGVNCMLNTATVLGVGVNIHGAGFPRVFVPSFSEGSPTTGFSNVTMKKFHDIAERVMSRRDLKLTECDTRIYEKVYEISSRFKG